MLWVIFPIYKRQKLFPDPPIFVTASVRDCVVWALCLGQF